MRTTTQSSPAAPAALVWRPDVLDRLEFILLLAAVAAAVLVYPLQLKTDWLRALGAAWALGAAPDGPFWARFSREQFEAVLSCTASPLILKGVIAGIPMLAFVAVRGIRRLLAPATMAPVAGGGWAWMSVPALFGWVALSAAWSPTPAIARHMVVWVALFGFFIFTLLRRGLKAGELRALAHFLILLGLVALTIVFLEALPPGTPLVGGKIFNFLPYFGDSPRNRYGSLLGHNTAAASFLMMTIFPCFFLMVEAWTRKPETGAEVGWGTWARRLAYGAYLGLALLAIVVLQSRAVWVFLPILGFLALRSALRQSRLDRRLRWLPTALLAVMALVLLSQSVDRPWNPLYIKGNPLGRRLKALGPQSLRGEARLRLNVISATLVPEHPLRGQGLFAFQYVYPKRQAEYYAEHPGTRLNMTVDRSDMAHNEYMQVLVDHGVIGLGLVGWVLWEIAARGRRRRREMRNAECGTRNAESEETGSRRQETGGGVEGLGAALLHEGVGWAALGFALHALVDFPYHVPQLAIPGLLLMTGWGALRPVGAAAGVAAAPLIPLGTDLAAAALRPRVFARLAGALLLALLVPLGGLPLIRNMQGDVLYCRGQAWRYEYGRAMQAAGQQKEGLAGAFAAWRQRIITDARLDSRDRVALGMKAGQVGGAFRQDVEVTAEGKALLMRQTLELTDALAGAKANPQTILAGDELLKAVQLFEDFTLTRKVQTLGMAADNYQQASAILPYHGLIPEELAETCLRLAQCLKEAAGKAAQRDPARAAEARGRTEDYLKQGLAALAASQRGLDGYPVYWTRAHIYRELAALHPGQGHEARYREELARAQFYCPVEHQIALELIGLLERDRHPDRERILKLKRQFWTIDPAQFRVAYVFPAYQAMADLRYAHAARLWDELVAIDPAYPEFTNTAIRVNQLAGNRERMQQLLDSEHKRDAISLLFYAGLLTELTITRDEEKLFKWFHYAVPETPLERAEYRAIELVTRQIFKRDMNEVLYTRPANMTETQWTLLVAEEKPRVLFHYFGEVQQARQAMDERLRMTQAPPSARFWIEGFYIAEALGDKPLMSQCLEQARTVNPQAPALPDLEERLKAWKPKMK